MSRCLVWEQVQQVVTAKQMVVGRSTGVEKEAAMVQLASADPLVPSNCIKLGTGQKLNLQSKTDYFSGFIINLDYPSATATQ